MTFDEFNLLSEKIADAMFRLNEAKARCPEKNLTIEFSEREILALAVGLSSTQTFLEMIPPKPASEFTDDEVRELVRIVFSTYAEVLTIAGLEQR